MTGWITDKDIHLKVVQEVFMHLAGVLTLILTLPTIMLLKLPFLSNFKGNSWNTCIFAKDATNPYTMVPLLQLDDNGPPQGLRPESLLTNISTLILSSPEGESLRRDHLFDVSRAVAYFPSLHRLVFKDPAYIFDMGLAGKETLLDNLKAVCSKLHVVKLDDKEHHIQRGQDGTKLLHTHTLAGILDLPNEILLAILDELHPNDLVSLALLSHHLNLLSFPLFFEHAKRGGEAFGMYGGSGREFSFLRFFQLSLFHRPPIPSMTLHFSGNFLAELAEVSRYVKVCGMLPLHVDVGKVCFNTTNSPVDEGEVSEAVEEFCTKLSKLDCHTLTCSRYTQWSDWLLPISDDFYPPALTTLCCIRFPGESGWINWLIRSMNHSPITTIIIEQVTDTVLDVLTLPQLCQMMCVDHDLILVPLAKFLNWHPTVKQLTLLGQLVPMDNHKLFCATMTPMASLTRIAAGLGMLSAFFGCRDCFPVLEEVVFHGPPTGWTHTPEPSIYLLKDVFMQLGAVLALISTIPTVTSLKLPFLSHFTGEAWNMCVFVKDHPVDNSDLASMASPHTHPPHPESLLHYVTSLTLYAVEGLPQIRDHLFNIAQAIGHFPAVRMLHVKDCYYLEDMGWVGHEDVLLSDLQDTCPRLEVVKFNIEEHHLQDHV
ncbi:hypothetical protein ARMGADRAFT_1089839 [Armillaria gallica]|uniref:F-box domain-containing protein n=1 Tax=Armillaria gallica TaxID=47427 RepID=A0A2H3D615_ARMGA|nr:hypothetical protein ARMGADRAFT_1089839 [Armillaria gallica]